MDGLLLIDKPKGWTSFDVVNKVRKLIESSEYNSSNKKRFPVGHTGTLDPLATGLLVLLLGKYTKMAVELIKLDKSYVAKAKLGFVSTTGDEEGVKSKVSDIKPPMAELETCLAKFKGEILQTPPAYSAIKVNGKRAYELARKGQKLDIKPRAVTIYSIVLENYIYPEFTITTKVSSGVYIRSLAEDVGNNLKTGAYLTSLRRTQVGEFDINDAIGVDDLSVELVFSNLVHL